MLAMARKKRTSNFHPDGHQFCSMHNDDDVSRQKFPQLTVILPQWKMSIYVSTDIIPLGGEAGGRGKGRGGENNITYDSFPVMRNNCRSYFFHAYTI